MKVLGKLFSRKKKTYTGNEKFQVLIIEENSSSLDEALGINEDRYKELISLSIEAYKEGDRYSDTCKVALEQCTHINEVVLVMTTLAKIKISQENPLEALLSKLGK
jgi:hypothetical protein